VPIGVTAWFFGPVRDASTPRRREIDAIPPGGVGAMDFSLSSRQGGRDAPQAANAVVLVKALDRSGLASLTIKDP
jgi:hypothetical protein